MEQIDHAVEILGGENLIILHTNSTYPSKVENLNLRVMHTLGERYGVPVGYSGHEVGLAPSVAAAAIGACMIERHITLDRAMWGSDQAASVEPQGFARMVKDVRAIEAALGDIRPGVAPQHLGVELGLPKHLQGFALGIVIEAGELHDGGRIFGLWQVYRFDQVLARADTYYLAGLWRFHRRVT